jgi:hypothetical protein
MWLIKCSSCLNRALSTSSSSSKTNLRFNSSSSLGNVGLCFAIKLLQPDLQIAQWINDRVFLPDKRGEQ